MKPRLNSQGRPIGQHRPQRPSTFCICQCPECVGGGDLAWDPVLGAFVSGKVLGRPEYLEHRRLRGHSPSESSTDTNHAESPPAPPSAARPLRREGYQASPPQTSSDAVKRRTRSSTERVHIAFLESMTEDLALRRSTLAAVDSEELIFAFPPCPYEKVTIPLRLFSEANTGPYSLEFGRAANRETLEYESWLLGAMTRLGEVDSERPAVQTRVRELVSNLQNELNAVEMLKRDEWQRRSALQSEARRYWRKGKVPVVDTSKYFLHIGLCGWMTRCVAPYFIRPAAAEDTLSLVAQLITAILFLLCNLSITRCSFIMMSFRSFTSMVLSEAGANPALYGPAASDMPHDVRTIVDGLHLKPSAVEFCCCPKCYCCYPIDDFPDRCTNKESHDAPPCGRTLRHTVKNKSHATRRYLHHDLKQWIGRLMRRPGIEDLLDRDVYDTGAKPGELRDIWDGEVLSQFRGDDGEPFVKASGKREGRLVFALNMDGFNPFQRLVGGATNSSTAIYMVCLNLPPDIRHRIENVFLVGIIPGPGEPSLTQINHFLNPLVNDLILFWDRGVYYTRTFKHARGRLVRCALVPVVCDTPAARQIMACGSHSSTHFCPYCGLLLNDLDNLDMDTWPPGVQTREDFVALAEQWRDASSSERKKLFEKHGIRYTELLRLSYWDPVKFVVIDSMHTLLLGNLETHCREYWGMDVKVDDKATDQKPPRRDPNPDAFDLQQAWKLMRRGAKSDIAQLKDKILTRLCEEAGLRTGARRNAMISALQKYVCFGAHLVGQD